MPHLINEDLWVITIAGKFLIPAKLMSPAKMEAGTKIGLNFALDDGGKRVEQFYDDGNPNGYRRPNSWGAATLAK